MPLPEEDFNSTFIAAQALHGAGVCGAVLAFKIRKCLPRVSKVLAVGSFLAEAGATVASIYASVNSPDSEKGSTKSGVLFGESIAGPFATYASAINAGFIFKCSKKENEERGYDSFSDDEDLGYGTFPDGRDRSVQR